MAASMRWTPHRTRATILMRSGLSNPQCPATRGSREAGKRRLPLDDGRGACRFASRGTAWSSVAAFIGTQQLRQALRYTRQQLSTWISRLTCTAGRPQRSEWLRVLLAERLSMQRCERTSCVSIMFPFPQRSPSPRRSASRAVWFQSGSTISFRNPDTWNSKSNFSMKSWMRFPGVRGGKSSCTLNSQDSGEIEQRLVVDARETGSGF